MRIILFANTDQNKNVNQNVKKFRFNQEFYNLVRLEPRFAPDLFLHNFMYKQLIFFD